LPFHRSLPENRPTAAPRAPQRQLSSTNRLRNRRSHIPEASRRSVPLRIKARQCMYTAAGHAGAPKRCFSRSCKSLPHFVRRRGERILGWLIGWDGARVEKVCLHGKALRAVDRKSTRLNSSHVKISYAV